MGIGFWIKRFLTVFAIASALLIVVEVLFKGASLATATGHGLTWGGIAAVVFIASRLYQSRKGQACVLCDDIPEKEQS